MEKTPFRSGELDQRIILKRETLTEDGSGGNTVSWVPVATLWAKVRPMSGREREHSDRLNVQANYLIVIRSRDDITEKDIVVWNGTEFNIRFVKDQPRSRFLSLEAEKGVA